MESSGSVIKAADTYFWYINQPDRLYQIADEFYQKAQEYQSVYSFQKAKIYYEKAEECYQRVRDVYKSKKQADEARSQADEARKQADEARKQADEARSQADEVYTFQKTFHRNCKSQTVAEYQDNLKSSLINQQPLIRRQHLERQLITSKPSAETTSDCKSRPSQEDKTADEKVVRQSENCASDLIPQQPPVTQDNPNASDKKTPHPISWRGKKYS